MKLIQEADYDINHDENVNKQLGKIQDAISKLEKLVPKYNQAMRPTTLTIRAFEYAVEDLQKVIAQMKEIRGQ